MSVRNIIMRILEIIGDASSTPDLDIQMRGSRLTLTADLGAPAKAPPRTRVESAPTAGEVSPEAILAVLERKRAGSNLAGIAKAVGVKRKMAIKPMIDALVAEGKIEKAGPKFRLPGRVKRGRRPGSASKVGTTKRPVVLPTPAPAKRPAVAKPAPKARPIVKKAAAPKASRPAPATKQAPAKPAPPPRKRPSRAKPKAAPVKPAVDSSSGTQSLFSVSPDTTEAATGTAGSPADEGAS